jgi:hypothetical protein
MLALLILASAVCGWLVGYASMRDAETAQSEALAQQLRETEAALDRCELGQR